MQEKGGLKDFCISEDNPYLAKAYRQDNYRVIMNNPDKKTCFIFFSGNGIYYPDTVEEFHQTIEVKDRYEWERTARSPQIQRMAGKIILIRDLYKTWYQAGINDKINSIEKVLELLQKLCRGYEVITCGNSAGGYMAALAGVYLNAKCVFDFSGQWSLPMWLPEQTMKKHPFLVQKQAIGEDRWFDIVPFATNNATPIFWFYSGQCDRDLIQADCLAGCKENSNICVFPMKSQEHGFNVLGGSVEYLLEQTPEFLQTYRKKHSANLEEHNTTQEEHNTTQEKHSTNQEKLISLRKLCFGIMPFWLAVKEVWKDIVRCHKSLQILTQAGKKRRAGKQ